MWQWIRFTLFIGLLCCIWYWAANRPVPMHDNRLPSVSDIQKQLNDLEPDRDVLKVDGKCGRATLEKWERVYCNQEGAASVKRAMQQ